jgi:hypothetical protein
MTQNVTVYSPFSQYFRQYNLYRIIRTIYEVKPYVKTLVRFKILPYSRVEAGAASKFLPGAAYE